MAVSMELVETEVSKRKGPSYSVTHNGLGMVKLIVSQNCYYKNDKCQSCEGQVM